MSMKTNAILSAIAAALCLSSTGVMAASNTFSGRATAVDVNVLGLIDLKVADAGPLKSKGGSETETAELDILGLLDIELLTAETSGKGNTAESFAEIADIDAELDDVLDIDLNIADGLIDIEGNLINAETKATCESKKAKVTGDSDIAELAINGLNIEVTGEPNQKIELLDLPDLPLPLELDHLLGLDQVVTLVLNEQKVKMKKSSPNKAEITVNAVHLTVKVPSVLGITPELTLADIVLAHAKSGITCK